MQCFGAGWDLGPPKCFEQTLHSHLASEKSVTDSSTTRLRHGTPMSASTVRSKKRKNQARHGSVGAIPLTNLCSHNPVATGAQPLDSRGGSELCPLGLHFFVAVGMLVGLGQGISFDL